MKILDEPTPIELTLPGCSICATAGEKVLRFNLTRHAVIPATGRYTSRGAGCIHLCERCWRAATREADQHGRRRRPRIRRAA